MREYDFRSLKWQDFEELCKALLHCEYPGNFHAVEGSGGDQGRDGFLCDGSIFAYHHPRGGLKRAKITSDCHKAAKFSPPRWVFVTSVELNKTHWRWVSEIESQYDFKIEVWEATKIKALLDRHPEVAERFFPIQERLEHQEMLEGIKRIERGIGDAHGHGMGGAVPELSQAAFDVLKATAERRRKDLHEGDLNMARLYTEAVDDDVAALEYVRRAYDRAKEAGDDHALVEAVFARVAQLDVSPVPEETEALCGEGIRAADRAGHSRGRALLRGVLGRILVDRAFHATGDLVLHTRIMRATGLATRGELAWCEKQLEEVNRFIAQASSLLDGAQQMCLGDGDYVGLASVAHYVSNAAAQRYLSTYLFLESDDKHFLDAALSAAQFVLDVYCALGDNSLMAYAHLNMATTCGLGNDMAGAQGHAAQALSLARKARNLMVQRKARSVLRGVKDGSLAPRRSPPPGAYRPPEGPADIVPLLQQRLRVLGIDANNDSPPAREVRQTLVDLDPTRVLAFCEHMRVDVVETDPLGKAIPLPTLGVKAVRCASFSRYGAIGARSLDTAFGAFRERFCSYCIKHRPRGEDFRFTWTWYDELVEADRRRPTP